MALDQAETGKWDNKVPSWPARGVGQMGLLTDTNGTFSARESVPLSYGSGNVWEGCPSTALRMNGGMTEGGLDGFALGFSLVLGGAFDDDGFGVEGAPLVLAFEDDFGVGVVEQVGQDAAVESAELAFAFDEGEAVVEGALGYDVGAGFQGPDDPHGAPGHVGIVLEELGDGDVVAPAVAQGAVEQVAKAEGHDGQHQNEAGLVVDEAAAGLRGGLGCVQFRHGYQLGYSVGEGLRNGATGYTASKV